MSSAPAALTYDAIYFASIPVYFAPVPGETLPFIASEWHEDHSSLPAALERFSLIKDPNGGLPLFHPAIPALDLTRQPSASASAASAEALPLQLRQPLLKVPESLAAPPPNTIQGYASGVRSAVIKLDGQWYCPRTRVNATPRRIRLIMPQSGTVSKDAETTAMASLSRKSARTSPSTMALRKCSNSCKCAVQPSPTLQCASSPCPAESPTPWRLWMQLERTRPSRS